MSCHPRIRDYDREIVSLDAKGCLEEGNNEGTDGVSKLNSIERDGHHPYGRMSHPEGSPGDQGLKGLEKNTFITGNTGGNDDSGLPCFSGVIGAVKQCEQKGANLTLPLPKERLLKSGFPATFKLDKGIGTSRGRKNNVSLFKQKLMAMRSEGLEGSSDTETQNVKIKSERSGKDADIHNHPDVDEENQQKISRMTLKEIDVAQTEILDQFDTDLLKKIASKFSKKDDVDSKRPYRENKTYTDVKDLSWIRSEADLETAVHSLPEYEKDKLRWTGRIVSENDSLKKPSSTNKSSESVLTDFLGHEHRPSTEKVRFDLEGRVVDPSENPQFSSGLYHHEENQDDAGYTIRELEELSRSQVPAQKAIALRTIGKMLIRRQTCLYEEFSTHPVFTLPTRLAMTIRIALDSDNTTVVSAALLCLYSFLVPLKFVQSIEDIWGTLSDSLFLPDSVPRAQGDIVMFAPSLDDKTIDDIEKFDHRNPLSEESPIKKDMESIDKSPVLGFIRTGLVDRLAYLSGAQNCELSTGVVLSNDSQAYVFRILAFIAMHSDSGALSVFENKALRNFFARQFVTVIESQSHTSDYVVAFLLLLQSLVASRREFALALASELNGSLYKSVECICASPSTWSRKVVSGAITLLRLWKTFGVHRSRQLVLCNSLSTDRLWEFPSIFYLLDAKSPFAEVIVLSILERKPSNLNSSSICFLTEYLRRVLEPAASSRDLIEDLSIVSNARPVPVSVELPVKNKVNKLSADLFVEAIAGFSQDTNEPLLELDRWHAWLELAYVIAVQEEALRIYLSQQNHMQSRLISLLDYFELHRTSVEESVETKFLREGGALSFPSPAALCWEGLRTQCMVSLLRLLLRLYGTTNRPNVSFASFAEETHSRCRILCSAVPRLPVCSRQRLVVLKLIEVILSPSIGLTFVDPENRSRCFDAFSEALGLDSSDDDREESNSLRVGFLLSRMKKSQRDVFKRWKRRWAEALSGWPLISLYGAEKFSRRDESGFQLSAKPRVISQICPSYIVDVVSSMGLKLLEAGAMRPESVVLVLLHFFAEFYGDVGLIAEKDAVATLNNLLNRSLNMLFSSEKDRWYDILVSAAGGEFKLTEVVRALLVSYNESLCGHETATALLVLLLRMEVDSALRLIIWTDLFSANLMHLVCLPDITSIKSLAIDKDKYYSPIEKNYELLQCMSSALSTHALTKQKNPFLHTVAVKHLAGYLWASDSSFRVTASGLSWSRKRLLKQLVKGKAFYDIVVTTASGNFLQKTEDGLPMPHDVALDALKSIAAEDLEIRKILEENENIRM